MFIMHSMNAILIFWIAIIAIVAIGAISRAWERTSRHRMIETLAEKGQAIPPELLNGRHYYGSWRYGHPIASGLYLMCIGVALAVFFWAMTGWGDPFVVYNGDHGNWVSGRPSWLPFIGIFPFMIGLARVLVGIVNRPPK